VPLHFSAFHPDWKMTDKSSTSKATLLRAREIALGNGVRYSYVGNVHDQAADSTYCHHCGQRLIGRDWYQLSDWHLTPQGTCDTCGTSCAGVFESHPGNWGPRRQPVSIHRQAGIAR
jgi:pyruvate formate lyase activating enzyme